MGFFNAKFFRLKRISREFRDFKKVFKYVIKSIMRMKKLRIKTTFVEQKQYNKLKREDKKTLQTKKQSLLYNLLCDNALLLFTKQKSIFIIIY